MRDVGAIVGGVARVQNFAVGAGFDADLAALDGEEFAGALEMRSATEGAAGLELNLVEFDVFLEI